jgi:hypothetical protein
MELGLCGEFKGKEIDSGIALDPSYANVDCNRGDAAKNLWRYVAAIDVHTSIRLSYVD